MTSPELLNTLLGTTLCVPPTVYTLEAVLGVSRSSTVYSARSPAGEHVVAKVFRDNAQAVPEAEALKVLTKVRGVPLFVTLQPLDSTTLDVLLTAMPRGVSAREFVLQRKGVPLFTINSWGHRLLACLTHIHLHGLVHRDVKPDNVVICTDTPPPHAAQVFLIDFGLACAEGSRDHVGHFVGSPAFASANAYRMGAPTRRDDFESLLLTLLYLKELEGTTEPIEGRLARAVQMFPDIVGTMEESGVFI